jgi:WD40 repeat protein
MAAAISSVLCLPAPANAATADVVWSAPGMGAPAFSVDGSLALAIANTSAGGRLEIRRSGTGALVRVVTNPVKFGAAVLSADNQLAAVTLNAVPRVIRIHRVSDGSLVRSITTVAGRDLSSIDFSPDGQLVAAADKRQSESGGQVHVHRVSDATTVRVLAVPATTAAVRFSPDGRFLAVNDRFTVAGRFVSGLRVFRTADWVSVLTRDDGALLVRWSLAGGSALWVTNIAFLVPTSLRLISVPDGAVVRTVTLHAWEDLVADVSNDDSLVLSGRSAAPRRSLKLTDTSTGAIVATYDFVADVFAGDLAPDSALFTYALTVAPSAFDGFAARR